MKSYTITFFEDTKCNEARTAHIIKENASEMIIWMYENWPLHVIIFVFSEKI